MLGRVEISESLSHEEKFVLSKLNQSKLAVKDAQAELNITENDFIHKRTPIRSIGQKYQALFLAKRKKNQCYQDLTGLLTMKQIEILNVLEPMVLSQ